MSASKPRLHLASLFITLQTDTLRLDSFLAFDGNVYVGATHDADHQAHEQCPVLFLVCKKDRAAYTRAAAAFNEIMDAHDVAEAAKNARRRAAKPRQLEEALS